MKTHRGWDTGAGGAGTGFSGVSDSDKGDETGDAVGGGADGTGFWNIRVNSPGCPGPGEPTGAAEGATVGFWNARVNSPGWDVVAGADGGFEAGSATGSGAWRNWNIRVKSPGAASDWGDAGCWGGGGAAEGDAAEGVTRHAPAESNGAVSARAEATT